MTPRSNRNPPLAVTLFWLTLAAFACLFTSWVARELGADWRLHTALGLGAGLWALIMGCLSRTMDARNRGGR